MSTKRKTDWFMVGLTSVIILSFVVCVWGIEKEIQASEHTKEKMLEIQDNSVNTSHEETNLLHQLNKHRL